MLSITDIIDRPLPPMPWEEGDNIPWDEPAFSERMLAEHLSQDHDLASRRSAAIDTHVVRLLDSIAPPPGRVLDLACGPGLYLSRLADAGYSGVGIDFSPAAITYARTWAEVADHDLQYRLEDLRTADFGGGYGAALLLFGQFNVFRRDQARSILARIHAALEPGGVVVLEPQTREAVERSGRVSASWAGHATGLFATSPHLLLTEAFWDDAAATATRRFYVVDAATGSVARHALSAVAYTEEELTALLVEAGFAQVEHRPSLSGERADDGLSVVAAVKPA
jgi:SAM-dependent methyltransferase